MSTSVFVFLSKFEITPENLCLEDDPASFRRVVHWIKPPNPGFINIYRSSLVPSVAANVSEDFLGG